MSDSNNLSDIPDASGASHILFPLVQTFANATDNERRDAAEHRRHILVVARTLFAEQGVEQVSMHQIARSAGIGQGTLYRRFPHKGHLCLVLLEESITRFETDLLLYFEQVHESTLILDQLYHMLMQLMTFTEENAPLLGAMLAAFSSERRTQSYQSVFYLWLREVVMVLLVQAIAHREIPQQDVDYVADMVLFPLSTDFYDYQRHQLGFSQQRIAGGLRQFLFYGLLHGDKKTVL